VVIDDYKGAFLATEHLIAQGYRRIAHISGPSHIKIFSDRLKGYLGALNAHSIPIDTGLIYEGNVSIDSGREAIKHFFERPLFPDAFFAVEDFTALGVMKELKEKKIRVPEEVGVVGFANEHFGEHISPSLSTIDQQTGLMGRESIKLLLELISNKEKTKTVRQQVVLEPIPVFRESSAGKKPATPSGGFSPGLPPQL
jgi:LacI family transcriptional regulator